MTKIKQSLLIIFRWLIAISFLVWVMYKIDSGMVWKALQRFDLVFGAIMAVFNIVLLFLMALRWKLIAEKLYVSASFFLYLKAVWLGALSGQIGPSLILSEVTRFKVLQNCGQKKQLISSQILDRLSGQLVLLFLLFLLLPISLPLMAEAFPDHVLMRIATFVIVLGAVIYGIFRYRQQQNIMVYRQTINLLNPLHSLSHYAISLLIQLLLMFSFLLAVMGLGSLQQPLQMISLLPLVLISLMLLPISVSDWGTRETAAVFFLSFSGLAVEDIVAASLIYGTSFSLTTLLGLFFLFANKR